MTARAGYTDDLPEPRDLLHLAVGMSEKPHARVRDIGLAAVRAAPGVVNTMVASDIPGENNYGSIVKDDPLLADGAVCRAAGLCCCSDDR
jgi:xanthine dehydrogenase large subunit